MPSWILWIIAVTNSDELLYDEEDFEKTQYFFLYALKSIWRKDWSILII